MLSFHLIRLNTAFSSPSLSLDSRSLWYKETERQGHKQKVTEINTDFFSIYKIYQYYYKFYKFFMEIDDISKTIKKKEQEEQHTHKNGFFFSEF